MSDTRELREALEQAQARVKQLEKARSGPAQGVELQRKLTRTEAALAQSEADVKELRRLQARWVTIGWPGPRLRSPRPPRRCARSSASR